MHHRHTAGAAGVQKLAEVRNRANRHVGLSTARDADLIRPARCRIVHQQMRGGDAPNKKDNRNGHNWGFKRVAPCEIHGSRTISGAAGRSTGAATVFSGGVGSGTRQSMAEGVCRSTGAEGAGMGIWQRVRGGRRWASSPQRVRPYRWTEEGAFRCRVVMNTTPGNSVRHRVRHRKTRGSECPVAFWRRSTSPRGDAKTKGGNALWVPSDGRLTSG